MTKTQQTALIGNSAIAPHAHQVNAAHPEFVTLPPRGGDQVCSMSRSWWLGQEKAGRIQLLRIRKPGQRKAGRVLLPVPQGIELVRRLTTEGLA